MMAIPIQQLLKSTPVQNVVPIFDFTGNSIGDEVKAADGCYVIQGKSYIVENGMLAYVWGEVQGQLEMVFEGI